MMRWFSRLFLCEDGHMALQDRIVADQQAVSAAQAALDAANAQLKDDQDALASWEAIEAAANGVPHAGVKQAVLDLAAQSKAA
jgi:predicted hotdog family 3-hydroxylacyl-ACP dehydratase